MKKTITLILGLLCSVIAARAQFYQLSTNLYQTNLVAASSTQTMSGTNYLDVRRYTSLGVVAVWSGSDISTNTVTWAFRASPDGTNWETLPRFSLVATAYGTNRVTAATNLDVSDVGYLRAASVVNGATNSLTNVVVFGQVKEYPRN